MVARGPKPGRLAFTLVEVLLTLCLLVILTSLTWPSLGRPLANQRLRSGTDQVRTEWARARVAAISSGRVYAFRYTPDARRFVVQCHEAAEFAVDGGLVVGAGGAGGESAGTAGPAVQEFLLPEGVAFAGGENLPDGRSDPLAAQSMPPLAAQSGPTVDAELALAQPILFRPDGTTSTALLRLVNEHGSTVEISLRGLTGVATVGPLTAGGGPPP